MILSRKAMWAGAVGLIVLTSSTFAQDRQRGPHGRQGRMADESRSGKSITPGRESESGAARSPGLSPEERRQLRQDIHQAGRDIYSGRGADRPGRKSPER